MFFTKKIYQREIKGSFWTLGIAKSYLCWHRNDTSIFYINEESVKVSSLGINASYKDSHVKKTGTNTVDGYNKGYNASVSQSLFSGFQTYNSVKAADSAAKAGLNNLYDVEQNVLLNASTAYLDVLRDEAIVGLQKK